MPSTYQRILDALDGKEKENHFVGVITDSRLACVGFAKHCLMKREGDELFISRNVEPKLHHWSPLSRKVTNTHVVSFCEKQIPQSIEGLLKDDVLIGHYQDDRTIGIVTFAGAFIA